MDTNIKPVVWGVLSTAKIGTSRVLPSMQPSPWVELRAIASRSLASAQAAAKELGIPVAYGSYEDLIADPEIEAIYNPLPNHLHVPLTLAAARAGKHVLCEKPLAISAEEAAQLREVADKVLIEEAFMVRHHPQWQTARELIRAGRIGPLTAVQAFFSYFNVDAANVRNQSDIGGGALYDIGCYAILSGRYLFEAEPLRVVALVDRDPAFGTDRRTSALVDFGGGRHLTFTVSTQNCGYQRVQAIGSQGRIEIPIPFNPPPGGATRIALDPGGALDGSRIEWIDIAPADQYRLQGEAFSRRIRGQAADGYPLSDAEAQMRVIDALFRSERSGGWELVA